jgi:hypothetical protein
MPTVVKAGKVTHFPYTAKGKAAAARAKAMTKKADGPRPHSSNGGKMGKGSKGSMGSKS